MRRTTPRLSTRAPRRATRAVRLLAAVSAVFGGLSLVPSTPAPAETPPFEYLGSIPQPQPVNNGQLMVALDPVGRRLYTTFGRGPDLMLGIYDLNPEVPTLRAERLLAKDTVSTDPSPYKSVFEPQRKRLYLLANGKAGNSEILVVGSDGNAMPATKWDMATIFPGFFAGGMTYSPEDDRIYLVGELSESMFVTTSTVTYGNKAAGGIPMVAAIDPSDGTLLWARAVPECRFPLYTLFTGSLIARSSTKLATPTLFFPCSPGSTTFGTNLPYQPGLTALRITPKATMAEAQHFDVRFHPISGNFFNGAATGVAGYDSGSDRLFLQSLSNKTPGAWVFDAHADTWVGAITAPTPKNDWLGINQRTGHYYMGGRTGGVNQESSFLLVADGRARRPQNGVNGGNAYAPIRSIVADPGTDRLFVMVGAIDPLVVIRDATKSISELPPPDYDSQTEDLPDTPESFVAFTGDAGGFGARFTAIGDTASVNGSVTSSPLAQASRSVAYARGPSTNLQPAGAAAAAQAAVIDTNTAQALRDNPQAPQWPYGTESCLDGGDGVDNEPEKTATGFVAVTCKLAQYEAVAEARQSGTPTDGVALGDTRHQSRTKRTVKQGTTTEAWSSSSGIRLDVPGAGAVEIGKVTAKAVTIAHGQPGSASATWARTVEDLVVKDLSGKVLFTSEGCSTKLEHDSKKLRRNDSSESCDELAEAVRRALQVNVRLLFPVPEVAATPKGAFAAVVQSEADHAKETTVNDQGRLFAGDSSTRRTVPAVQLDIYHDSIERSRQIVQLAGVEATSIFTVNRSLSDPDCATGGCIPGGSDTLAPIAAAESAPTTGGAPTPVALGASGPSSAGTTRLSGGGEARQGSFAARPVGFVFTRRSLGEGLLMVSFLLLSAAAVRGVTRRARLLELLTGRS